MRTITRAGNRERGIVNTKILVVDDEPDIRDLIKDVLEDEGFEVDVAEHAGAANERKAVFTPHLVLLDIWMPDKDGVSLLKQWNEAGQLDCPVVMMSGHGTLETAVEATRYGAFDFIEKPLSTAKLLHTVKTALDHATQEDSVDAVEHSEMPVGNSQQMEELRQQFQARVSDAAPVIMTGPAGSGVSLWAAYLVGLQKNRRLVSEVDKLSSFSSLGVNLFIREVAELDGAAQKQLLEQLQQESARAGSVRLIVASRYDYRKLKQHKNLLPELAAQWKQAIVIPSLNQRVEDIPELLEYYVTRFSEKEDLPYRHFGVAAQNMIRNHDWRGGLSELRAVVRRILSQSREDEVNLEEISELFADSAHLNEVGEEGNMLTLKISLDMDLREAREFFEREYLQKQLELCRYNVSELARKIGQERTNLYRKLKSLGLQTRK